MAIKTLSRVTYLSAVLHLLLLTGCASLDLWNRDESKDPVEFTAAQKATMQFAMGRAAEGRGDAEGAMRSYTQALETDDSHAEAYHRLALLNDKLGECEKAHGLYRKAIERAPDNAEIHCDFAYNCYLQGRWGEAEQGLRRAIALKPDLARAHNNLGLLLGRTGRADEALWEFHRAGASEAKARTNLAFAMLLDGHVAVAERQLDLAARQGTTQTHEHIARLRGTINRSRTEHYLAAPDTAPNSTHPDIQPVSYPRP